MKRSIAVVCLTFALGLAALAQTPVPKPYDQPLSNVYAGGISFNNSGSPSIAGTGLYARFVTGGTYAFTVVDALPNTLQPFTVTTNFSVGFAQKIVTIGKYPIFVPTAAGVSYHGTNVGWAWSTGGMTSIKLKNNWRLFPAVRVAKSSVSNGTGYQLIPGLLVGWGN